MFSSINHNWATPSPFFKTLDDEFGFTLDVAASTTNAKCKNFYTEEDNGLIQSWEGHVVWCNPPYGRDLSKWVKKAYESKSLVVMLIPARTDTSYWHEFIFPYASEIRFIKGRITFEGANDPAPFPSALVIFGEIPSNITQSKLKYGRMEWASISK